MKKIHIITILAILCSCSGVKQNQIKYSIDIKKICEYELVSEYEYDTKKDSLSLEEYIDKNIDNYLKQYANDEEIEDVKNELTEQILEICEDNDLKISSHKVKVKKNTINGIISFEEKINRIPDELFASLPITEIILPSSISHIGEYAFSETFISEIILPSSISHIGEGAFSDTFISEITLPKEITEIPHRAFEDCEHLTTVIMPQNINIIGESAFEGCKSLKNIDLNNNIDIIGKYAFRKCENLNTPIKSREIILLEQYLKKRNINYDIDYEANIFTLLFDGTYDTWTSRTPQISAKNVNFKNGYIQTKEIVVPENQKWKLEYINTTSETDAYLFSKCSTELFYDNGTGSYGKQRKVIGPWPKHNIILEQGDSFIARHYALSNKNVYFKTSIMFSLAH